MPRRRLLTGGALLAVSALLLYSPARRAFKSIWNPGPASLPPGSGTSLELIRGGRPPAGGEDMRFKRRGVDLPTADVARPGERLQDALSPYPAAPAASAALWKTAQDGRIHSLRRGRDGRVRGRSHPGTSVRGARRTASPRKAVRRSNQKGTIRGSRRARSAMRRKAKPASGSRGARAAGKNAHGSPDFDGRRAASSGSGASGSSDSSVGYISIYTRRREPKKEQAEAAKKFAAPKLADWLGQGPLKPPKDGLKAPGFSELKEAFPDSLPDGKAYERKTPPPSHLETLIPPGEHPKYERWLELDKRRGRGKTPHWHIDEDNVPFRHMGDAWGRADGGRWAWMMRQGTRWWTVADGAQRMVRHEGHWWWKTRDGWFLLHQGEPWAYRHFADWKRDGLIHPASGARIVYSEDGRRVAVVAPDGSARVFDAVTGELIVSTPAKP